MNHQVIPIAVQDDVGKQRKRQAPRGRRVDAGALADIQALLGDAPRRRDLLIEHLHKIQDGFGHLSAAHLAALAQEMRAKGIVKPIVASLAGDVEVEEAAQYLYEHGIPSYAYSTEIPVAVLGAKYQWARGAGLL